MHYIDGFVAAVPTAHREQYLRYAQEVGQIIKSYGAVSVVDCWGDDVPEGKLTSFPMAVKREPDETVVFGWIAWPDKATRDAAWKKMETDPRMQSGASPMPFDGKRMIYGGFQTIASA
jgi:uncharacterized protein YbaA (DUF1428 family)